MMPHALRALPFALLLAASCAAHAAAAAPVAAPDVARDPPGAWKDFLARAELEKAYGAYGALDKVGYDGDRVDPAACREGAAGLDDAIAIVPVSPALRRAAMLCAEANGDTAGAERQLAAIAALVRHALAGAGESPQGPAVRVLRLHDIRATLLAAGLEPHYAYFPDIHMRRTFPLVVAARDPERDAERHLRFDFLEATMAIARSDEARYPHARTQVVHAVLGGLRDAGIREGVDAMAWRAGRIEADPAAKIAQFRMGAGAGGVQSARTWLVYCAGGDAPPGCADGLVDTLLPHAERKWAWPLLLLAYAHAEGVGVARDAGAGGRLLDAADARWSRMGATVAYARLWREIHGAEEALPPALLDRLERAQAAGNEDARSFRLHHRLAREPAADLDAADIAFLSRPSQNGHGDGLIALAAWAEARKQASDHDRWVRAAAEAGNPWAQADIGYELAFGKAPADRDRPAGLRHLADAAHGGSVYAARLLASEAMQRNDYAAAEQWLVDAAGYSYDTDATLDVAALYEWEYPGVNGDPAKAIRIYRDLAAQGVAEARRRLALMAMQGRHMTKDPAEARALLEAGAKDGDHEAEGMLGLALLGGQLGPVDEEQGIRWVERALAGGDKNTSASYGHWLFYTKATAQSRAKALEVWRTGIRNADDSAANNLAWAFCTAPDEALRDASAGLAATREMGELDDLPWPELDTVAACRAAAGDFEGAVELQRKVNATWKTQSAQMPASEDREKQTKDLEERLRLYEAGKPYVEPAARQG